MPPSPISIAETIACGVAFDPQNSRRVKQMDLNELFASVGHLFDLLEQRKVDYVLTGGIALLSYVEGRNTQDVDLILSRKVIDLLPELTIEDENQEFLRARLGELQVDVLLTTNKLFARVAASFSTKRTFADRKVNCVTPEGLLLLKLFALPSLYRQGQFDKVRIYEGDIEALAAGQNLRIVPLVDSLGDVLLESDLQELSQLAVEMETRIVRAKSRFRGK